MRMLRLLVFLAALAHIPATAEYWDESLGLYFPDSIARFAMLPKESFGVPELGYCVGYKSNKTGLVSFYVYNNGLAKIPDGGDSKILRDELTSVTGTIPAAWKSKGYEVKTMVESEEIKSASGGVIALQSVHQISNDTESFFSITVLTGYKNNFLKVRYSTPDSEAAIALERLAALGKAFGEYNEKLVQILTQKEQ